MERLERLGSFLIFQQTFSIKLLPFCLLLRRLCVSGFGSLGNKQDLGMIGWVHLYTTYIHYSISESYWINIWTSSYSQWRDETQMCAYFLSYGYVTWSKLKVVWRALGLEMIIVDTTKTYDTHICWWMSSWSWFVHFYLSEESKQDKGKYAPAT